MYFAHSKFSIYSTMGVVASLSNLDPVSKFFKNLGWGGDCVAHW